MTARRVLVERRPVAVGRLDAAPPADVSRDAETRAAMRRQLSAGAFTAGAGLAVLVGAPVLAAGIADVRWWVALSVGVQPVWVLLAVRHLRHAEQAERAGP
ncbi:hypothetical protein [Nonomuraea endophytica]|uniref:Uncharacterized protein n=1 Tax=Nonomuraea endophytica TaxID=714136 RepID=A0A7W8AEZ3_9ACTN|nr:hypothetical protein [Nonomuraea endophytica]MBB5084952.1 hypothetical protein [Nonomuraea endophytica]